MEIRQIKHFVAVAEERQFTRAARRVHIVQSALSTSIRSLEEELEAVLFQRSTRTVRLTAAGRAFYPKARRILEMIDDARDTVAGVQGLKRGKLTIGIIQNLAPFVDLASMLGEFRSRYPGIEISLQQASASRLLEKIRTGDLDLAFVSWFTPRRGVASLEIAREPFVVACAPTHALAQRKQVSLAELGAETFIDFQADWGTRLMVDRAFQEAGISRNIAYEMGDIRTLLDMVARGLGIALVTGVMIEEWSRISQSPPVHSLPLAEPAVTWKLAAVYRDPGSAEQAASEPVVDAFLDLLRNTA